MNEKPLKLNGMFWDWMYWLTITHESKKQVLVTLRMSYLLADQRKAKNRNKI